MRRIAKVVNVGNVKIGGNEKISIQSMLNAPSYDVEGNVEQALKLKKVGCEIKVRRIRNGITQTEFVEFLGVSQTYLSNVESGLVMLSLKLLLKIKRRFVCTLDEIVDPEGYKELLNNKNKLRRFKLVRCDE